MRSAPLAFALLAFIGGGLETTFGDIAGGRGGPTTLFGRVRAPEGRDLYGFEISYYREEFQISSVYDKYKLVRVRVSNYSTTPLRLSAERDRIDLLLPGNSVVRGLLDLQSADSQVWDAFDAPLRQALAYPSAVKAAPAEGVRTGSPEVIYLFAFYPKDMVTKLPVRFEYWVDSLQQSIRIEPPPPRAD